MNYSSVRQLLFIFIFSLLLRIAGAARQCYYPDGTESPDVACSQDTSLQEFCCPSGDLCTTDPGPLCQTPSGDFVRGSCTVQDWSSVACPKFCLAVNTDNDVNRCSSAAANGHFCCGYDTDKDLCDCNTNNNTFSLLSYKPIKVEPTAAASSSTPSPSSSSIPTSNPATSTSSATSSTTLTANTASSGSTFASNTATSSTTLTANTASSGSTFASNTIVSSTPATPSATSSSGGGGGTSTAVKVSVGVAVPLCVIIIALVGWLAYKKRKSRQNPAELPLQSQMSGTVTHYSPSPMCRPLINPTYELETKSR